MFTEREENKFHNFFILENQSVW